MYLWLVEIVFDINYLSNKILLKQGWRACTKQLRVQCGSITLSKSFRPCLICLWTGFQGTGYIYMHKACGTLGSALRSKRACAEDSVSTLYMFQVEAITSVSCSHFPVTGWVLIDGWCALGGIKPFGVIWRVSNLGALRQLHSENDGVVSGDHQKTGFTSVGFMLLIQTETQMQVQPSMSNARLDSLGCPLQPSG